MTRLRVIRRRNSHPDPATSNSAGVVTLAFRVRAGVQSMNETYPLERVTEAYDRMVSGKSRSRVVLTIG